jgi:hypothetical protein
MGVVTIEGSAYFFLIVAESGRLVCLICVSIARCGTAGGNTAIYRNFLAQKHYCAAAVAVTIITYVWLGAITRSLTPAAPPASAAASPYPVLPGP